MRIWILTVGEPLPVDGSNERLFRSGLLAQDLARRGHDVTFWSSAFDHVRKQWRTGQTETRKIHDPAPYELVLLKGTGYRRNISLARMRDHRAVAREFARLWPSLPRPDVILCSIPIVELATEALKVGCPVALDCRDMWPDIFADAGPSIARPAIKRLLSPLARETTAAFRKADAVLGHTAPFVDWGLQYAGRAKTKWDRDFPFGYTSQEPDAQQLEAAKAFWDVLGVGTDPHRKVLCFFGAISHQFEFDELVMALRTLSPERRRSVQMVLCGDGENRAGLAAAAADLADGSLVVPGWVDRAAIWELMRRSSMGLAPYQDEPMYHSSIPNKVIEYFSAGLPVAWRLSTGLVADMVAQTGCGMVYGTAERLLSTEFVDGPAARQAAAALFDHRFKADIVYPAFADHLEALAKK